MAESMIGQSVKAWCSKCRGNRNCQVHGHYAEGDNEGPYDWQRTWYLLTCRGCDHVFAQSVFTDSENVENYYDRYGELITEAIPVIKMWPAKAKRVRPSWFEGDTVESKQASFRLDDSLRELYGALDNDLNVLATIGMRTSFDIAAEDLGIDPGLEFREKIDDLVSNGAIKASERDHISILIDAGNASAHRGWAPKTADLHSLMDVLEQFLLNSFVLPAREIAKAEEMAALRAKVPQRAPRKKKNKSPPPHHDDD